MRVLVAPDSFRGTASAVAAARALAEGVREAVPDARTQLLPIADGGEGTLDAFLTSGYRSVPVRASGPLGEPVDGRIAVRGADALVELAELCGWPRQRGPVQPLAASSTGLGDGVRAALDAGCRGIVLAVGGSVSTDGGLGLLAALGGVVRDERGRALRPSGAALQAVAGIDLSGLDPRLAAAQLRLATDVTNPLVGPLGAAPVFAPQKGAGPAEVTQLDAGLRNLADVLFAATGVRVHAMAGTGAAGGVGAVAVAVLGARIVSGADLVLDAVGFDVASAGVDLVITGEGSWDAQSRGGKAAARAAARSRAPVALVAGRIDADGASLRQHGFVDAISLVDLDADRALTDTTAVLRRAGRLAAERWAVRHR